MTRYYETKLRLACAAIMAVMFTGCHLHIHLKTSIYEGMPAPVEGGIVITIPEPGDAE